MEGIEEKIVPPQHEGTKKDIMHTETAIQEDDARKLFVIGRNRLLSINHWHEYSGAPSARFVLTDHAGNAVDRTAEIGDYFKIDLPATPGTQDGKGYDWVRIEAIEDKSDTEGPYERIAIRVRPTSNPTEKGENIAHFFNDEATSSFVIERDGKKVTAAVFGRNEVPNTETSNVVDTVRNAIVGITAILGFSNVQWNSLVKGLIKTEG